MTVLRARGVGFTYGGAAEPALRDADLDVAPGEVVLLAGPSGGGKTTLLRALGGLIPHFHGGHFEGSVAVGGLDTLGARPAALALRAPLLFQDPETQAVMDDVERDVAFGLENAGVPPDEIAARVAAALNDLGAGELAGRRIRALSGGERQRVALAGLLALRPAAILLDEPTSQLDDAGARAALERIVALARARGVAVVLTEHRLERLDGCVDRAVGVAGGRLGAPAEPEAAPAPPPPVVPGDVTLRVEGLVVGFPGRRVLEGVDLELRAGAVTCLRGANGSGKSTLLRCLAGLHAPEAGRVWLAGREVGDLPPEERFPAMGFVGQNPWRHLLAERVDAEVQLGPAHAGVARPERRRRATALLERLELGGLGARHPHDLSSGQRQRVAVAAALASEPRVLMLDEPTRGADPVSRRAIIQVLRDHTKRGGVALVATHDTAFAHEVGDVHLALREGVVVPTVEAGGVSA